VFEGLLGLRPVPVPPDVFAVEPGRLAYGRFVRTPEGFEPAAFEEQELPPNLFQSGLLGGPVREPEALDAALASLLERIEDPIQGASLVVPDTWLRVAFTEVGELPSDPKAREEVLRWKLKRLVPFRVEELRLGAVEVEPLPRSESSEEPHRLLLGFGLEALLRQMETAFDRADIHLGQITSASLALLGLLAETGAGATDLADEPPAHEMTALALVENGGYTLSFARQGEPVLQRFKGAAVDLSEAARGGLVERDLKLTRRFLEEQFPSEHLGRVVLVAPPEREPEWTEWLEAGLGRPVEPLSRRHLPLSQDHALAGAGTAPPWRRLAPMLGAASREVA